MAKKLDFDKEIGQAVQRMRSNPHDRFARAKEVLAQRPTGHTPPPAPMPGVGEGAVAALPTLPIVSAVSSRLGTPSYMEVPLDLIDDNPYNARQIYQPEKVAELAVKRDDRYILIAAHYRKKAAKQAGLHSLKLMVYENVSDQDLYLLSYKENAEHNAQTPLDNAYAWKRVLDQGVYQSEVELAEAIGMSKANVNKTLSIMKLDSIVLDVVAQHPEAYGLSLLYELHLLQQVAGSVLAADMALRVVEQGIGRKEVAAARERIEATGTPSGRRRRNETSRLYRLQNGQVREWDSGRVLVDMKFDNEESKRAFMEEVMRFKVSEEISQP